MLDGVKMYELSYTPPLPGQDLPPPLRKNFDGAKAFLEPLYEGFGSYSFLWLGFMAYQILKVI